MTGLVEFETADGGAVIFEVADEHIGGEVLVVMGLGSLSSSMH